MRGMSGILSVGHSLLQGFCILALHADSLKSRSSYEARPRDAEFQCSRVLTWIISFFSSHSKSHVTITRFTAKGRRSKVKGGGGSGFTGMLPRGDINEGSDVSHLPFQHEVRCLDQI